MDNVKENCRLLGYDTAQVLKTSRHFTDVSVIFPLLHDVTSQRTLTLLVTAVKTQKLVA